jgi:hypothetical protein
MIELLLPYGFDTLEYSWVRATIGICMLADYSMAKKCQEYAPSERYVRYGDDKAERAVEGIRRLERWVDDVSTMQTKMQASIDSQTSMMHDLFGHFRINHDA